MTSPSPKVRTFGTGATRDLDANKLDYEGFFSPLVMERFAQYMHGKRRLADGSLRDGDNWQKGMPKDSYMKSGFRHFFDWWTLHRGWTRIALEPLEVALCGLMFNVMGYLHETIKARLAAEEAGPGLPFDFDQAHPDSIRHELGQTAAREAPGSMWPLHQFNGLAELAAREAGDATLVVIRNETEA